MASHPPGPPPTEQEIADANALIYGAGLAKRRLVAGPEHVARSLSSPFSFPMQELATTAGWAGVWTRPGLELRQRSLLVLVMLSCLNRMAELKVHVRGAVRNGVTMVEIREALLMVAVYAGMPAGLEATRTAEGVLKDIEAENEAGTWMMDG